MGREITHWKRGDILGRGAFGSVRQGLNLDNGELFAVKEITDFDDSEASRREIAALENEIGMLKQCDHVNIVRYLGCERTNNSFAIFLEYVSGGSICALLERYQKLDEPVVRVYTRQLLLGLEYLHCNGFAHRDIKGANVLVTTNGIVKLADFGASKRIWGSSSLSSAKNDSSSEFMSFGGIKGTAMWMAPEVIREDQAERVWRKADIWSVGCTVIEMLTGKPPWSQFSNPVTAMYHIACGEHIPDIPDWLSEHGKSFLRDCFRQKPSERPDVCAILLSPFMAKRHNSRTQESTTPETPPAVRPTSSHASIRSQGVFVKRQHTHKEFPKLKSQEKENTNLVRVISDPFEMVREAVQSKRSSMLRDSKPSSARSPSLEELFDSCSSTESEEETVQRCSQLRLCSEPRPNMSLVVPTTPLSARRKDFEPCQARRSYSSSSLPHNVARYVQDARFKSVQVAPSSRARYKGRGHGPRVICSAGPRRSKLATPSPHGRRVEYPRRTTITKF